MSEIWKDIKGFEGLYQISNGGRIKSLRKSTKHFNQPFHYLSPTVSNTGYYQVTLYKTPKSKKKFLVHRLVATHFLPNPENYPCVNHKDENKLNNNIENLEWCTYQYNNAYGTARIRATETSSIQVQQFTIDGVWIATYQSATIAAKLLNISKTSIADCCRGKAQFAHGYVWKYIYRDQ